MTSRFSNDCNTKTTDGSVHYINEENRRAIIFYNAIGHDKPGREKDSANLKNMLQKLRFEVEVYGNLNKTELFSKLEKFRDGSKDASCLFVFILTHGTETELIAYDARNNEEWYKIEDLLTVVSTDKNNIMAYIPKLVFIDACRGEEYDRGFPVDEVDGMPSKKLQQCSNLMIASSSTPGYRAYLNENFSGTKYNEWICKILLESSRAETDDLMSMLTKVNYEVGYMNHREISAKQNRDAFNAKQMPFITSTFKTKLYLSPLSNNQHERTDSINIKSDLHVYNMDYGKGLAVILHDSESVVNCAEYQELFNTLGFTVKSYEILTDLKRALERVGDECENENPKQYTSFVCCIVAKCQGEQTPIHIPPYWKDHLNKFFTHDQCTFFVGKPKIFFMHLDENETKSTPDGSDVTDSCGARLIIPRAADILIYSVKENISQESPTVAAKEIIEMLKSADRTEDLVTTLTKASQCIKDKTPTIFSTLTGKVFLK